MADSNKNAAISFLKMAAKGKVHEAYAKYVGTGSGTTIHFSKGRQSP